MVEQNNWSMQQIKDQGQTYAVKVSGEVRVLWGQEADETLTLLRLLEETRADGRPHIYVTNSDDSEPRHTHGTHIADVMYTYKQLPIQRWIN